MEPINGPHMHTLSVEVNGSQVNITCDGLEVDERFWRIDENGEWVHVEAGDDGRRAEFTVDTDETPDQIVTLNVFTWETNGTDQVNPNDTDRWDIESEGWFPVELRIVNNEGEVTVVHNNK